MLNSLIDETVEKLYQFLVGTCNDTFQGIDILIDYGDIDSSFFYANENAILTELDSQLFQCETCGWQYPIEEMSIDPLVCNNCKEDEE